MSEQRLRKAVLLLCDFIRKNCGETDDWPMEILFDNEVTANKFAKLLNKIDKIASEPCQ
jgi:hypothetical protein